MEVCPTSTRCRIDLSDAERPSHGEGQCHFLAEPSRGGSGPVFSSGWQIHRLRQPPKQGTEQVFVRPFSGSRRTEWKVSLNSGWKVSRLVRRDARNYSFLGGDDRIMAASYSIQGDSFQPRAAAWPPRKSAANRVPELRRVARRQTRGDDAEAAVETPTARCTQRSC